MLYAVTGYTTNNMRSVQLGADYVGELTCVWLMAGSMTWLDFLVKSLLTAMPQLPMVRQPGKAG